MYFDLILGYLKFPNFGKIAIFFGIFGALFQQSFDLWVQLKHHKNCSKRYQTLKYIRIDIMWYINLLLWILRQYKYLQSPGTLLKIFKMFILQHVGKKTSVPCDIQYFFVSNRPKLFSTTILLYIITYENLISRIFILVSVSENFRKLRKYHFSSIFKKYSILGTFENSHKITKKKMGTIPYVRLFICDYME